jgi:hypothetical protein
MKHFYILTFLSGLLLTNVFDAGAARRYVKTGGTVVTNASAATTWAAVCTDLQAVINASAFGDEIWIAAGVYKPIYTAVNWNIPVGTYPNTPGISRDNAFILKEGVKIYGSFVGTETSLTNRN